MKSKFLIMALLVGMQVFAETSLVVCPMFEAERATAMSTKGYVKLCNDSMSLYSKGTVLLGRNRLSDVCKVAYEDREPEILQAENTSFISSSVVFPNPTSDALVIQNANCEVARVFNLEGKLLLTATVSNGSATLNISALSQGTYLLQLNTELVKFI